MSKGYDVLATIRFFNAEEGGRKKPLPPKTFSCLFYCKGSLLDCRVLLEDVGPVQPGDSVQAPLKFLDWPQVKALIKPGDRFELRELRIIAEGMILEIVDAD